jgi:hypothetical protein
MHYQSNRELIAVDDSRILKIDMCGLIDETHIPLVDLQSKKATLVQNDFFNRTKIS